MKRSIKNVLMLVVLFIILLLLVVTIFKATNERITIGAGDPGVGGMGGANVDGVLILPDGTEIYADGTGKRPDGTLLTWEDVKLLMPNNLDAPPGQGGGAGEPPGGMGGGGPMEGTTINELDKKYYIYFGVESLVFLLILAYLLLSKLNKKDFNETFDDKLKFILLAIIAVFGTAIFTYASGFISDIWAEKLAETKEAETQNNANAGVGETTTPDANQGTTGTETTVPNAGATPEGGENILPEGNPEGMNPNVGMQTPPADATTPEQGMGTMPPEGTSQPGNPGEGGGMPPQMP